MNADRHSPAGEVTKAPGDIEQQALALLELIEADRARQSQDILAAAREQAAALHARSHAEARARLRQVFAEQRRQLADGVAAARARLATQRRLHAQQRSAVLLQLAWERLPGELRALWERPDTRAAWIGRVMATAHTHMPGGNWHIVHAPDWPMEEQLTLAGELPAGLAVVLQFEPDARIVAGVRVVAGGNVIDGTVDGLLGDRAALEARLLHLLEDRT